MLIAKVPVAVQVDQVCGHQYKYRGHVVHSFQVRHIWDSSLFDSFSTLSQFYRLFISITAHLYMILYVLEGGRHVNKTASAWYA